MPLFSFLLTPPQTSSMYGCMPCQTGYTVASLSLSTPLNQVSPTIGDVLGGGGGWFILGHIPNIYIVYRHDI